MRCRGKRVAGGSVIVEGGESMKLMGGWKFWISWLVLGTSFVLCLALGAFAQDKTAQEQPGARDTAQGKTKAGDTAEAKQPARAKPGTKQAVEARLKAAEHAKPTEPIHEVEKTLFATRRFEQAVISPDGKRVVWVEQLIGKEGAPSGHTAIYVAGVEAKAPPKRLKAG